MQEKWNFEEQTFRPPLTGTVGIGRAVHGKDAKLSTWSCLWQQTNDYRVQELLQRLHTRMEALWTKLESMLLISVFKLLPYLNP